MESESYIFWEDGSDEASSAYILDIALAKYSLAWGLLICGEKSISDQPYHTTPLKIVTTHWLLALNVGVRRPFSNVKGSWTKVIAFTNSKPLNWK